METNVHHTAEIDDDLHGDLTIRIITASDALDFSDTYDDRNPVLVSVTEVDTISNVASRSHSAQIDEESVCETVLEAYSKEPAP